ncbi:hypothetical protein [Lysobacter silvisoli]|uniref:Uncharacterized protein n=1 Tax=Lysobacter silvisoli TaxID=2293254 RepID=A0A371K0L5_9GAMM|nr:hypothetical protein [Lysobacter silvisoli]RDZ27471.1 hypothetical protein DX914_14695 [Lysobacter silvisoli]
MGRVVLGVYVVLIFVFAIYGNWWGDYAYKGFAFNFGRALIWPVIIIPGLGKAIGMLVLLGVIGFLTFGRK